MEGDALHIAGLSKHFGGARALDGVSLSVRRAEVHGLLGSNGSGKSTLIKVLAGFHTPEPGASVALYGKSLPLPVTGSAAKDLGLAFVHQDLGFIPSLSVAENFHIQRLASGEDWRLSWRRLNREAADAFARYDLDLDPRAPVESLAPVERALLAIVRAAEQLAEAEREHASRPGVLILDEPTPFLPKEGVDELFKLMRRCTQSGASVIFVSHDIDEVRQITDRATILRDGKVSGTVVTAETDHSQFVELIVGRALSEYRGGGRPHAGAAALAEVSALTAPGTPPLSFALAKGEIVGVTGLIGAGYGHVPAALFGALPGVRGKLTLDGAGIDLAALTPEAAISYGIAYVPADRAREAAVGTLPVGDNIALPVVGTLKGRFGLTSGAIMRHAARLGASAGVRPNAPELPLSALSGGNAQKAVLAKWLQNAPKVILLDEPTQGVDVGARQQIWDALDAASGAGAAILVASSDYEQLAAICHRVLIFAGGTVRTELSGASLTKDHIAEAAFGTEGRAA